MPQSELHSPRIKELSWGNMTVEHLGRGKDFKLWPGGGREWDWKETGTRHTPGIQPADVEELLEHGSRIILLSRGMLLMLHTAKETCDLLKNRGVEFHIEETKSAMHIYNQLAAEGTAVGGLFHSTC